MKKLGLFTAAFTAVLCTQTAVAQLDAYQSKLEEQLLEKYKNQRCQCVYRGKLAALRNPELVEKRRLYEEARDRWIQANAAKIEQSRGGLAVNVPVVVHVVYKNSIDNISDAQIQSQIDVLNEDFRKLNADFSTNVPASFQSLGADVEFEFCMASVDPQGNSTNGITRTQTTITNIGNSAEVYSTALGGHDAWDTELYMNIWVAQIGGGTLGYTYLPGEAAAGEDGLVISPDNFGTTGTVASPLDGGRTTTHECGHWFDLLHIWDEAGCGNDDGVNDTPTQDEEYYGCPTHPQVSCGSNDMFMNYMDYTDDGCMGLFTTGQKTRMHAALNTYRSALITSNGCGTPASVSNVVNNLHLTVAPNPASDQLRVVINTDGVYNADLRLVDLMGRTVLQQNIEKYNFIDVSNLESGVYVLEVKEGQKSYTQKVVIQ